MRRPPKRFEDERYLDPFLKKLNEKDNSSDEDHTDEQESKGPTVPAKRAVLRLKLTTGSNNERARKVATHPEKDGSQSRQSDPSTPQIKDEFVEGTPLDPLRLPRKEDASQHIDTDSALAKGSSSKANSPADVSRITSKSARSQRAESSGDKGSKTSKRRGTELTGSVLASEFCDTESDYDFNNHRRPLEFDIAELYDSPVAELGLPPTTQFGKVDRRRTGEAKRPTSPNQLGAPQPPPRKHFTPLDAPEVLVRQLPPEHQLSSIPGEFWNSESDGILDPGFQDFLGPNPRPLCFPIAPNNPHSAHRKEWPSDSAYIERHKSHPERSLQPQEELRTPKTVYRADSRNLKFLHTQSSGQDPRPHSTDKSSSRKSKSHRSQSSDAEATFKPPGSKVNVDEVSTS